MVHHKNRKRSQKLNFRNEEKRKNRRRKRPKTKRVKQYIFICILIILFGYRKMFHFNTRRGQPAEEKSATSKCLECFSTWRLWHDMYGEEYSTINIVPQQNFRSFDSLFHWILIFAYIFLSFLFRYFQKLQHFVAYNRHKYHCNRINFVVDCHLFE